VPDSYWSLGGVLISLPKAMKNVVTLKSSGLDDTGQYLRGYGIATSKCSLSKFQRYFNISVQFLIIRRVLWH